MPGPPLLPPDYEAWSLGAGGAVARRDVAGAVRAALAERGTLYAWASGQSGRTTYTGRGAAYGVSLGGIPSVVRHARRGGYVIAPVLGDRFLGTPRFLRELQWSHRLLALGVPTPAFLAGAWYRSGPIHRADVATERVDGADLAALLFDGPPLPADERHAVLAAVARLVRRLHDAGVVHPDLQLRNVLVGRGTAGPVAALLDVDTCRRAGPRAAARNLRRFFRSWKKWNRQRDPRLDQDDRAVFEAAYAGAPA